MLEDSIPGTPSVPWTAPFVSGRTPTEANDPALYFRREVEVGAGLQRATLSVTAIGLYEPYVNGVRVGDEVLAPGWTSYKHRLMVSSFDVTELFRGGLNAVGAIVAEGWAVGALTWDNTRHNYADRPALSMQLTLDYGDRIEQIVTDELFRVGHGAVRTSGIYAGEEYDARREANWFTAGFDDRDWERSQMFDWDLSAVEAPTAPPIRRIEELVPVEILTTPSGKTIVDFGQNISGWVRFTVTGEAGQTVTLRHAEALTPSGELETESNRTAAATDRYTLKTGSQTWEPRFTFHGFRYVEVDGWPGEVTPEDLVAVVVHSDMGRAGWFECSNDLVSKLHANVVWSMRGNFVGVPTDCPQRDERLGWTGDLNAFARTATYLYDVDGVLGSWLQDLAVEQFEAGSVPWVVPDVLPTQSAPTALWSDVAISLPWELYQEYGDIDVLRRAYPSMVAFMSQVEGALDERGLWGSGFQFGDWLDPDAPADNPAAGKTDRYLVACAYLCKTTRELEATARLLEQTQDIERFAALADRVRAAFRDEFVTPTGRVVNETATAYALAIMFDTLGADQRQKAGDRLAEIIADSGYTIATGFAGTPLVTEALSSTGHLAEAYLLLLQTKSPSFLYPVTMGATTVWERWDAVLPDGTFNATGMTSLNHYALGAVADWLHRVVGGLQRTGAGWSSMRIAPQPGGNITSATTSHQTVHGLAEVSWRVEGREMVVDVAVPDGATAEVVLPLHPEDLIENVARGAHSWRYLLPEGYGATVHYSLDSRFEQLLAHPSLWSELIAVMKRHYPAVPLDAAGKQQGEMTLRDLLGHLPTLPAGLEPDLERVLASENEPA